MNAPTVTLPTGHEKPAGTPRHIPERPREAKRAGTEPGVAAWIATETGALAGSPQPRLLRGLSVVTKRARRNYVHRTACRPDCGPSCRARDAGAPSGPRPVARGAGVLGRHVRG